MIATARLLFTAIGLILGMTGLVWVGQGTGLFPYPATSFMINQNEWIAYGMLAMIAGLGVIWAAQSYMREN